MRCAALHFVSLQVVEGEEEEEEEEEERRQEGEQDLRAQATSAAAMQAAAANGAGRQDEVQVMVDGCTHAEEERHGVDVAADNGGGSTQKEEEGLKNVNENNADASSAITSIHSDGLEGKDASGSNSRDLGIVSSNCMVEDMAVNVSEGEQQAVEAAASEWGRRQAAERQRVAAEWRERRMREEVGLLREEVRLMVERAEEERRERREERRVWRKKLETAREREREAVKHMERLRREELHAAPAAVDSASAHTAAAAEPPSLAAASAAASAADSSGAEGSLAAGSVGEGMDINATSSGVMHGGQASHSLMAAAREVMSLLSPSSLFRHGHSHSFSDGYERQVRHANSYSPAAVGAAVTEGEGDAETSTVRSPASQNQRHIYPAHILSSPTISAPGPLATPPPSLQPGCSSGRQQVQASPLAGAAAAAATAVASNHELTPQVSWCVDVRQAPSLELSPAVLSEATADVGTAAETSETTDKSPQSRSLISNLIWHSKGRRSYKLPRGTSSSPAGDATRTKSRFSLQAWASTSNSTAASDTVVVDAVIDASHDDPLGSSNGNGNGIQSPPPSSVLPPAHEPSTNESSPLIHIIAEEPEKAPPSALRALWQHRIMAASAAANSSAAGSAKRAVPPSPGGKGQVGRGGAGAGASGAGAFAAIMGVQLRQRGREEQSRAADVDAWGRSLVRERVLGLEERAKLAEQEQERLREAASARMSGGERESEERESERYKVSSASERGRAKLRPRERLIYLYYIYIYIY